MAQNLDDGEFWLPSEFLTDDDILMEKKTAALNNKAAFLDSETAFCFPTEFPYDFPLYRLSDLNSPVESVVGSTETESDEEDFMAGLNRQMARSILQQAENNFGAPVFDNPKTRVMSGSPQSPLCGVGSWSGRSGSSRGSPNGPSQVSSPPTTPINGKEDAWDLLYAAAGQMVRMNMSDRGLLVPPPRKPSAVSAPPQLQNCNSGFYSDQGLTQQQIQANHFHQLKQQQQRCNSVWGKQGKLAAAAAPPPQASPQVHTQPRSATYGTTRCSGGARPLGLPVSAWPPLQQQPHQHQHQHQHQHGSGMRAVFLGGSGTRRESSGTGVFLPRRTGALSETRKKPACSTVLLPARVVQALNLNFEAMGSGGAQPRFSNGGSVQGNVLLSQQTLNFRHNQASINTEVVQLPQEWTY